MAGAFLDRSICGNPVAAKIDECTGAKTVSALRMLYVFAAMAILVTLVWVGSFAWHRWGDGTN
jgi:hypothetical protein